ncbi:unnamed protein product [Paramecium octaurelia]|uniref:Uncharacterized protein n=1 Tax=Paramecium octaurelia TaxID=43137 RepID=A0A8S1WZA1_PAROT|nr:unnamed protein product [Paramecium octaurelia]
MSIAGQSSSLPNTNSVSKKKSTLNNKIVIKFQHPKIDTLILKLNQCRNIR